MIGAREIARMQPHAILINTARAAILDEAATRSALEKKAIGGAGFDVYWQEPLPADHWLRKMPNVLLQPHLGGYTMEAWDSRLDPAVDMILNFLDNKPQYLCNPEVLAARGGPVVPAYLYVKK